MALGPLLTDVQWAKIQPLLPSLPRRRDGRGRPWADDRACLEGVLWGLRTGAQWKALPPVPQSLHVLAPTAALGSGERTRLWIWRAFLAELGGRQRLQ